ncbi:MAG TPA: cytochrome c3 family protein [Thermodesulfobacteriota bacterium]|nr:cytochrome c3 family protein [Thermodesulfobacteriota bacterium]
MNKRCCITMLASLAGIIFFLSIEAGTAPASTTGESSLQTEPTLVLSLADRFANTQKPPVPFHHEQHVTVLKDKYRIKGCTTCHPKSDSETVSYRFPPGLKGDSKSDYEQAYHNACQTCHRSISAIGSEKLPLACAECHIKGAKVPAAAWPDAGFDYYSHANHVSISQGDCSACHHTGDMVSCRDCHGKKDEGEAMPYRDAAHISCLRCHLESPGAPASCGSCHAEKKNWTAIDIANAERPDVGQPDATFITTDQATMKAVPFNHELHEGFATSCRTCHHKTMNACDACHTIEGSPDGGNVTLATAFHKADSARSCLGCHNERKAVPECAGCHATILNDPMSQNTCRACHLGETAEPTVASPPGSKLLPEGITYTMKIDKVKVRNDAYEAARFPHSRHINSLTRISNSSPLARYFHREAMTLCSGCHHHSPLEAKRPVPPCSTCHLNIQKPGEKEPGLLYAYHRQCLECHRNMNVQPTSCTGCHPKKVAKEQPKQEN